MSAAEDTLRIRPGVLALRSLWLTLRHLGPFYLLALPGALVATAMLTGFGALERAGWIVPLIEIAVLAGAELPLGELLIRTLADGVAIGWTGGAVAAALVADPAPRAGPSAAAGFRAIAARPLGLAALGLVISGAGAVAALPMTVIETNLTLVEAYPEASSWITVGALILFLFATLYVTAWLGPAAALAAFDDAAKPGPLAALRRSGRLTSGARLAAAATGGVVMVLGAGLWAAAIVLGLGAVGYDPFLNETDLWSPLVEQGLFSAPVNIALSIWLALWILRLRERAEGGDRGALEQVFD